MSVEKELAEYNKFKVGDIVKYKDDKDQYRIWEVLKISANYDCEYYQDGKAEWVDFYLECQDIAGNIIDKGDWHFELV